MATQKRLLMKHRRHLIPLVQDLHQLLMQVFYFTNVECRRNVRHQIEFCKLMKFHQKGDNSLLFRSNDSHGHTEAKQTNFDKTFFIWSQKRWRVFSPFVLYNAYGRKGDDSLDATFRRLAIWLSICRAPRITATSLASQFSVSKRTILHDIDVLSQLYPIVTVTGRRGGYEAADWCNHTGHLLSQNEMDLLLRVSKTLRGNDALLIASIISKVSYSPITKIEP